MKKTNFLSRVLGGKARKGLMIFSLLLLFGFGFHNANAQYVSEGEAVTLLTQEVISIDNNLQAIMNSGNTTELERAEFKMLTFKSMIENIEKGNTVSETIEMIIGDPTGTSGVLDAQLYSKGGVNNQWLIDDILELLTL